MTPINARLAFAVEFTQMDLGRLSQREWQRLWERIAAFLVPWEEGNKDVVKGVRISAGQPLVPSRDGKTFVSKELTEADIRQLQTETLAMLGGATDGAVLIPSRTIGFAPFAAAKSGAKREISLFFSCDVPTGFLLLLSFLMRDQRSNRIRRCLAQDCKKFFLKIGKKEYCSRTCTNRANVRAWRNKQSSPGKEAKRA